MIKKGGCCEIIRRVAAYSSQSGCYPGRNRLSANLGRAFKPGADSDSPALIKYGKPIFILYFIFLIVVEL